MQANHVPFVVMPVSFTGGMLNSFFSLPSSPKEVSWGVSANDDFMATIPFEVNTGVVYVTCAL